jgi:hypothetical protein
LLQRLESKPKWMLSKQNETQIPQQLRAYIEIIVSFEAALKLFVSPHYISFKCT